MISKPFIPFESLMIFCVNAYQCHSVLLGAKVIAPLGSGIRTLGLSLRSLFYGFGFDLIRMYRLLGRLLLEAMQTMILYRPWCSMKLVCYFLLTVFYGCAVM